MMGKPAGAPPRRGLARGLSALLADVDTEIWKPTPGVTPTMAPVEFLKPSPLQPRRRFDRESIEALTESIRSKGVIQPLIVRPDSRNPGAFEIVAGERRWRAAQAAKIHEVPIVVLECSDREALEVGLVENIQRADLTPLEEAAGYRRLIDEYMETRQPLPNQPIALARIAGVTPEHWEDEIAPALKGYFNERNDLLHIKRCDILLDEQDAIIRGFSELGKKGAAKRWPKGGKPKKQKDKEDDSPRHSVRHSPRHSVRNGTRQDKTRQSDKSLKKASDLKKSGGKAKKKGNEKAKPTSAELLADCRKENPNFVSSPCLENCQKEFPAMNCENLIPDFNVMNVNTTLSDPDAAFIGFCRNRYNSLNLPEWQK
ncbi:MAG: ParB/RepB/Spo0J family partition protein [Proteobacteria bacterium]|nr:ParB/RepB/Spo0J family partition protein [Pseudomonadota bacterium]